MHAETLCAEGLLATYLWVRSTYLVVWLGRIVQVYIKIQHYYGMRAAVVSSSNSARKLTLDEGKEQDILGPQKHGGPRRMSLRRRPVITVLYGSARPQLVMGLLS